MNYIKKFEEINYIKNLFSKKGNNSILDVIKQAGVMLVGQTKRENHDIYVVKHKYQKNNLDGFYTLIRVEPTKNEYKLFLYLKFNCRVAELEFRDNSSTLISPAGKNDSPEFINSTSRVETLLNIKLKPKFYLDETKLPKILEVLKVTKEELPDLMYIGDNFEEYLINDLAKIDNIIDSIYQYATNIEIRTSEATRLRLEAQRKREEQREIQKKLEEERKKREEEIKKSYKEIYENIEEYLVEFQDNCESYKKEINSNGISCEIKLKIDKNSKNYTYINLSTDKWILRQLIQLESRIKMNYEDIEVLVKMDPNIRIVISDKNLQNEVKQLNKSRFRTL